MRRVFTAVVAVFMLAPVGLADEADDQYRFLAGLHDRGLHELAAEQAETFLAEHERHPKADLVRYRLAFSLFELGRLDEAAPLLERLAATAGFEFRAECAFRLAECELERGDLEAAAHALDAPALADEPYLRVPVALLRGDVALRRGDAEAAESAYRDAADRAEDETSRRDAAYGLAWSAYRRGDLAATVERIGTFLSTHGDDSRASELRFLLGEAHHDAGRTREALKAYDAVSSGPYEDAAWRGAAFALAELGDHAGAAERFAGLLERFPASGFRAEAALHRGIQLLHAGRAAKAREALSVPDLADDAEALYWRSRAAVDAGDPSAALADIERALSLGPQGELAARLATARGDVLLELGRDDDAVAAYTAAASDYALHAGAVARLNAGEPRAAEQLARRLLDEHPDSPYASAAQLAVGEALFAQERWNEAQAPLRAAAEDPRFAARAGSRIAWCRYLLGDAAGAAKLFADVAAVPDAPESDEALFMQGRAEEDSGDVASARTTWERYLERYPDGAHRADAMMRLARHETDAAARVQRMLTETPDHPLVPQALYELAERLAGDGDTGRAARWYERLLAQHADHELAPAARYGLAWCRYEAEAFAEAADHCEAVADDEQADPELRRAALELLVWSAREAGAADRAAAAAQRFVKASRDEGRRVEVARAAALALRDAGRADAARALLDGVAGTVSDPRAVQLESAYLALESGALDDAVAQAEALVAADPADAEVAELCFFVGEACFEAGDDPRAIALYRAAASGGAAVADRALYKLGFTHLRGDAHDAAADAFDRVVADHPDSDLAGESLFLAGEAHFRAGRYGEASQRLRRVLAEHPGHDVTPKALFRAGVSACQLERWDEAETLLSDLARRFPEFENGVEGELWRGRALASLDKNRAAREAFERVVKSDRGVLAARARIGLGGLELAEGRTEDALSEFLKVAVLYAHDDEVSNALFLAGRCLESLGDTSRARQQYEELIDRFPRSEFAASAQRRLGELESL